MSISMYIESLKTLSFGLWQDRIDFKTYYSEVEKLLGGLKLRKGSKSEPSKINVVTSDYALVDIGSTKIALLKGSVYTQNNDIINVIRGTVVMSLGYSFKYGDSFKKDPFTNTLSDTLLQVDSIDGTIKHISI